MSAALAAVEATADRQARLAAARSALTRAETVAGLRTRLQSATGTAGASAAPAVPAPSPEPPTSSALPGEEPAVPAALAPLFPGGTLARGSVVQVSGSTSLLLALTASLAAGGAWTALTAMPDVGWRAAAEAGLELERVIAVPRLGPDAPVVLGALVDGVDLMVVGRCSALAERDRRSLSARLRARQAILLSTDPWPGSNLVLGAEHVTWEGLGQGWGALARRQMTVSAVGRGAAAGPLRTVQVSLGPDGLRPAGPSPASPSPAGQGAPSGEPPVLRAVG